MSNTECLLRRFVNTGYWYLIGFSAVILKSHTPMIYIWVAHFLYFFFKRYWHKWIAAPGMDKNSWNLFCFQRTLYWLLVLVRFFCWKLKNRPEKSSVQKQSIYYGHKQRKAALDSRWQRVSQDLSHSYVLGLDLPWTEVGLIRDRM